MERSKPTRTFSSQLLIRRRHGRTWLREHLSFEVAQCWMKKIRLRFTAGKLLKNSLQEE
jgi:hypothetical protein